MQTMQIQGIEVQVEGRGARTVLMLHGWPDSAQLWDGTVQALSPLHRCVRLTLPGFDPDQALGSVPTVDDIMDTLRAVMDAVSPHEPLTLLLHDWGCIFGYELAMRYPDRVAAIVAVDVGDYNTYAYRSSLNLRQKFDILSYQFWLAGAWVVGRYVHQGLATRMTRWMARKLRCPTPTQRLHWQLNYPYAMAWLRLRGGLKTQKINIQCPMLYVYGERKSFMFHSPRWVHSLRASDDGAAHGLRCRHWVMLEQPEAFHALVLRWLAGRERRKNARY